MASSETEEFIFAADAIGFSLASNFYGTRVASQGFTDKKKNKFDAAAVRVIDCAKACWKKLESTKPPGLQISKNAILASVPEIAVIVGGVDPNSVMPAMLQLALTCCHKADHPQ